jgi:hypothetical protein
MEIFKTIAKDLMRQIIDEDKQVKENGARRFVLNHSKTGAIKLREARYVDNQHKINLVYDLEFYKFGKSLRYTYDLDVVFYETGLIFKPAELIERDDHQFELTLSVEVRTLEFADPKFFDKFIPALTDHIINIV